MKLRINICLFMCLILFIQSTICFGFETDQFNLPPEPLADIGDEVSEFAIENLREVVEKVNDKIRAAQGCAEKKSSNSADNNCRTSNSEKNDLKYLRSEDAIAKAIYKELGDGIFPFTKANLWLERHEFKAQPARFKTSFQESIYLTAPFNYLTISPTVNLYGTNFGTDKMAHFFDQGYDYYKIYKRGVEKGLTEDEAIQETVKWGHKTEKTYFGTLVSGVYSNADLYSNYAGLKFYLGLTKETKIGNSIRPAILILENGFWKINENADLPEILLKPFISKHLNEAYNPSKYFSVLGFRSYIRRVVRKQSCEQWFERFPNLNKAELEATTKSLELWNGEDYGFSSSEKFVTIANTCFD